MNFWDDIANRYKDEEGGANWQNILGDAGSLSYKNGYENQGMWGAVGKAIDAGNNPRADVPQPPRIAQPNPYRQVSEEAAISVTPPQPAMGSGMDVGATQENAKMAMAGMNQKPSFKKPEPYEPPNALGAILSYFV